MKLRPYQEEAVLKTINWLDKGYKFPLGYAFTGAGKTVMSSNLVMQKFNPEEYRTLFIVSRSDICEQSYTAYVRYFPELLRSKWTNKSRPGAGIVMGDKNRPDARIIFGTPQTLSGAEKKTDFKRLEEVEKYGLIDFLVIDEAHLEVNARMLKLIDRLKAANPNLRIFGMTATPYRADNRGLDNIFDVMAFEYSIVYGMDNGYICQIEDPVLIQTKIKPNPGSDLEEIANIIDVTNWNQILEKAYLEHGQNRPIAWFMPSVEHSRKFCEYMRERGHLIAHVDHEQDILPDGTYAKQRRDVLEWYESWEEGGKPHHITNFGVLDTGWDCPIVSCIGLGTPAKSPATVTQIIGRGVRLHPSKANLRILDFQLDSIELITAGDIYGDQLRPKKVKALLETEQLTEGTDMRDIHKAEERVVDGDGVVHRFGRIKVLSKNRWATESKQRFLFCSLSADVVMAIHMPNYTLAKAIEEGVNAGIAALEKDPDDPKKQKFFEYLQDGYQLFSNFTLWMCKKGSNGRWQYTQKWLEIDSVPQEVMTASAEYEAKYTDRQLAARSRTWYNKPPTEAQKRWIQQENWGEVPTNRKRAAEMITENTQIKALADLIYGPKSYKSRCGRFADGASKG